MGEADETLAVERVDAVEAATFQQASAKKAKENKRWGELTEEDEYTVDVATKSAGRATPAEAAKAKAEKGEKTKKPAVASKNKFASLMSDSESSDSEDEQ